MKVLFKDKWFGPTDFKGGGYFTTCGQRFRRGVVYDLSEDMAPLLPKGAVIIEDGVSKTAEQFNKESKLADLEAAKQEEVAFATKVVKAEDNMKKAKAVQSRNLARKKADLLNEKHGVE